MIIYRLNCYFRKPYGTCVKDIKSYQSLESVLARRSFSLNTLHKYSQKHCMQLCLNDFLVLTKNVTLDMFQDETKPYKSATAVFREIGTEKFWNNHILVAKCLKDCPIECHTSFYTLATSQASYSNALYQNYVKVFYDYTNKKALATHNFTDWTDMDKKTLSVNIFYRVTLLVVLIWSTGNFIFINFL